MSRPRGTASDPAVSPAVSEAGTTAAGGAPASVLIVGCGYVGSELARQLVADGVRVFGVRRDPTGLPDGVVPVAADVTDPASLRAALPHEVDAIVYAVSPATRSGDAYRRAYVDGLRHVVATIAGASSRFPGRLILVGSTGVYGTSDGSRVDEDTPPAPSDPPGEALLEAEAAARALGTPGVVLRLGGIYGPGRDRTIRQVRSGNADCPEPGRFGNRIHRDDAAGAVRHLLAVPDPAPVYLGVDLDPADLRDVYRWIARTTGVADPCRDEPRPGGAGAPKATRRGTNKRCSSARLVTSGFRFRYPTFREGYAALLEQDTPSG